ncbi:ROK family protein [Saccharibacillus alkalitolerans]|uniref:fructokinase n=1 Tax=Saccharibacillus alkalitolerans TaxID=2705290 RepID=A0ABX0F3B0_9BACL|nr:ROK family protein [Saccharibacillus alkalitolerans]NGZ75092.1 ROK family protein [Saccharibacillus alkalitolerans]
MTDGYFERAPHSGRPAVIGAIEAGGTKFVCGIGDDNGSIHDSISFPTGRPEETLRRAIDYFSESGVKAIGVGSFGPIDLRPESRTYGFVTTTPKPGWNGFDFLGALRGSFGVPCGWDTDVNAAAYGEAIWGAARGLDSCVYYTIGTGVGIGVYAEGRLLHGLLHPEGGHMRLRRHPDDGFAGVCPYHGDCLEGMASGPALEARWGTKGHELAEDHPAWEMEAHYIAESVASAILLLSPRRVILGGGVMQQQHLLPLIRRKAADILNGYVAAPELAEGLDDYIVAPGLGTQSGLRGALALGIRALERSGEQAAASE